MASDQKIALALKPCFELAPGDYFMTVAGLWRVISIEWESTGSGTITRELVEISPTGKGLMSGTRDMKEMAYRPESHVRVAVPAIFGTHRIPSWWGPTWYDDYFRKEER